MKLSRIPFKLWPQDAPGLCEPPSSTRQWEHFIPCGHAVEIKFPCQEAGTAETSVNAGRQQTKHSVCLCVCMHTQNHEKHSSSSESLRALRIPWMLKRQYIQGRSTVGPILTALWLCYLLTPSAMALALAGVLALLRAELQDLV